MNAFSTLFHLRNALEHYTVKISGLTEYSASVSGRAFPPFVPLSALPSPALSGRSAPLISFRTPHGYGRRCCGRDGSLTFRFFLRLRPGSGMKRPILQRISNPQYIPDDFKALRDDSCQIWDSGKGRAE